MKHQTLVFLASIAFFLPSAALASAFTIDTTGGDCPTIGTWDAPTLTCTLTQNTSGAFVINADNITLDGAGYTLAGTATTTGVTASSRRNLTVKNLNLSGFQTGMEFFAIHSSTIEGNTIITGNRTSDIGLGLYGNTTHVIVKNNLILGGGYAGISGGDADSDTFIGNTIKNFQTGLHFEYCAIGHIFEGNTVEGNTLGAFFAGSSGTFTRNNFKNNARDIQNGFTGCGNGAETLSKPLPIGGNYWSMNTVCVDGNHDNICDASYAVATSTSNTIPHVPVTFFDNFPWISENGWNLPTTSPITLSAPAETEDDNNQDAKGVAGKTVFTFSVTATGTPDFVKLIATSTTDTFILYLVSNGDTYTATSTFPKGHYAWHIEATASGQTLETTDQKFTTGYSNVAFLPGIEASRLYRPEILRGKTKTKVWEPSLLFHDNAELLLYPDGTPKRVNLFTEDLIDEVAGFNVYESFIDFMNKNVADGVIRAWKPFPYDWRFDVRDIVENPIALETGSYSMTEEIQKLAESSDTGKVTVVAHSMGGLVAKTLAGKLGTDAPKILDQMIFVASPQAGTPQAVGAILHGYEQGLPKDWLPLLINSKEARELAVNMPSAYGLLPSAQYFTFTDDPVVSFATTSALLAPWRAKYGDTIHSSERLRNFLADTSREAMPVTEEMKNPIIGNDMLFGKAETLHGIIDAWTPPEGVALTEIAGWGEETLAMIEYYEGLKTFCTGDIHTCRDVPALDFKPKMVLDGDGTVVAPSALWTPLSSGAGKYWVDLKKYGKANFRTNINRKHADILEITELRTFIQNIIQRNIGTLPQYKYLSVVAPEDTENKPRLRFTLHSPLTLDLYDALGNHTGISTTTNRLEENIPGSRYRTFGEVKYISVPSSPNLRLVMNGYATGSFTLDMEEVAGETITASTVFAAIPSAVGTVATIHLPNGTIASSSSLFVDENGDGTSDFSLAPKLGGVAVPDFTPPEAVISFSTTTNDVIVAGTDAAGKTTTVITATSTAITDEGGNTLFIPFTIFKEKPNKLKIVFDTLIYNDVATTTPKITLEYEWEMKNGTLKELHQDARIKNTRRVSADFKANKDETKIADKVKEEGEKSVTKITKSGIVPLVLSTQKGGVLVTY